MNNFNIIGVITYIGDKNKDGFFIFHITTTKEKKTNIDGVKEITIPFQGLSNMYNKVKSFGIGEIVVVQFDITSKIAKQGEILYVNLLAINIDASQILPINLNI
jgi:hypothetical protein